MFKSALTPSLVGFTVRRPQTTAEPPQTPPPPPPRKRAPSTDGGFFDALRDAAFGDKAPTKPQPPASGADVQKPYRVIVKHGDDLRQDQVVLQFVLLMDLLLKRVNLDMKLTCYGALATGASSGIVQFVEDSKAISDILAENQSSILNYLRANNPDAAAPNDARATRRRMRPARDGRGLALIATAIVPRVLARARETALGQPPRKLHARRRRAAAAARRSTYVKHGRRARAVG